MQSHGAYQLDQLDDDRVQVIWQQHLDPGGKIPAWIIKGKLQELPLRTLSNFREQVEKDYYQSARINMEGDIIRIVNDEGLVAPDAAPSL